MARSIRATFDGEVLRPEEPLGLRPNATYAIVVEGEVPPAGESPDESYPLTAISRLATDMGVTDLATKHDSYAHRRIEDPS